MIRWLFIILACLFYSQALAAELPSQAEIQQTLTNLCMIANCEKRPNPHIQQDAADIINRSVILAYYDNSDKVAAYNRPLKDMKIENFYFVPQVLVEKAVCKYYGFNLPDYEELQKAADEKILAGSAYPLGIGDPGLTNFNVQNMQILKNGLLRVEGTDDVGDGAASFIGYFKKSICGGKEHWVLLKLVYTDQEEEKDDFCLPDDK